MYVMETSGLPVGQVRFEKSGDLAEINYSLDKIVRNRRWASLMLRISIKLFGQRSTSTLKARVKSSNTPSASVFKQLGFLKVFSEDPTMLIFQLEGESAMIKK